ncbi:MAG: esterase/lipase family protein, partial [Phycisphaerales bacterium]
ARRPGADLGRLYDTPAQQIGDERVPVVVLPGILGTKLNHRETGLKIWGAFTREASDADTAQGARDIALPMVPGQTLAALQDDSVPDDVLDFIVADVGPLRGIKVGAYVDILMTLAAGKYRDRSLGESGAIDYGGQHYTCFQYPYDWRRDVSESAVALHAMIADAQQRVREGRGLPGDAPVKVDIVAHSMGGLVLRYYLRYGTQPLPEDGSLPTLNWAGARNIERAFLIGTPSAGSVESLQQLVDGLDLNPLFPNYRPGVLGTMPSIYQLLPRPRQARVVDAATGEPIDVLDVATWQQYGWGLAGSGRELDRTLGWLLPDAASDAQRREIALDHLTKCLARAEQFFRAIDVPASPPAGTELFLFAGDGDDTSSVLAVDPPTGRITVREEAPGDGTVTRASALMDERTGGAWVAGLRSPIDWHRVQFLNEDHLGLTKSVEFSDNLLYLMLEAPRD